MIVDLVIDEVDPYKAAMHNHPNGGYDTFFHSKRHKCGSNILHGEVCILFTCLFNFKPFFSFWLAHFISVIFFI
jgi:hypothetical protein